MKIFKPKKDIIVKVSQGEEDRIELAKIAKKHRLYVPAGELKTIYANVINNYTKNDIAILFMLDKPITAAAEHFRDEWIACFTRVRHRRKGFGSIAVQSLIRTTKKYYMPHKFGFVPCYEFFRKNIEKAHKRKTKKENENGSEQKLPPRDGREDEEASMQVLPRGAPTGPAVRERHPSAQPMQEQRISLHCVWKCQVRIENS